MIFWKHQSLSNNSIIKNELGGVKLVDALANLNVVAKNVAKEEISEPNSENG